MCSTTGPKYFFQPSALGPNGGGFSAPVAYASSPQATTDVGNPANVPAPPPQGPAAAAPSNPMQSMLSRMMRFWGGGARSGPQRSLMS